MYIPVSLRRVSLFYFCFLAYSFFVGNAFAEYSLFPCTYLDDSTCIPQHQCVRIGSEILTTTVGGAGPDLCAYCPGAPGSDCFTDDYVSGGTQVEANTLNDSETFCGTGPDSLPSVSAFKANPSAYSDNWFFHDGGLWGNEFATGKCGLLCSPGHACFAYETDGAWNSACIASPVDFKGNNCALTQGEVGCNVTGSACVEPGNTCWNVPGEVGICVKCAVPLGGGVGDLEGASCDTNDPQDSEGTAFCCESGFMCKKGNGDLVETGEWGTCKRDFTLYCNGDRGTGSTCLLNSECASNICTSGFCSPIPVNSSCPADHAASGVDNKCLCASGSSCVFSDGLSVCKPDGTDTNLCKPLSEIPSSSDICTFYNNSQFESDCCNSGRSDGDPSDGIETYCVPQDASFWEGISMPYPGPNKGVCRTSPECNPKLVSQTYLDELGGAEWSDLPTLANAAKCEVTETASTLRTCCFAETGVVSCDATQRADEQPIGVGFCLQKDCAGYMDSYSADKPCCPESNSGETLVPSSDGKCHLEGEGVSVSGTACTGTGCGGSCPVGYICNGLTCELSAACFPNPRDYIYTGPIVTIDRLLGTIFNFLYPLGVLIGIVFNLKAGYCFMTSDGDPQKLKDCQEQLTHAVLGTIFILLSVAILRVIMNSILGVSLS